MKRKLEIIIYSFLLLLTFVSAAEGASWNINDNLNLGSDTQDRDVRVSESLAILNTDTVDDIENISITFTATKSGYSNSDFNVTFSGVPSTIAANSSAAIDIETFIPLDFDSINSKIGELSFSADSNNTHLTKTVDIFLEAKSNIDIDNVEIEVDDDSERVSSNEVIDAKRDDSIVLTVNIENIFSSGDDISIDDIEVTVECDDLDIDETEDLGDLDARDDDEVSLEFDIPDDADDGKETVIITVEGEDENGAMHTSEFSFRFDVEVERYDVMINRIDIYPQTTCPEDNIRIDIELENTGLKDLDEATIYLEIEDFDITRKITDIEIDEGDQETETINFVIPKDAEPGTYFINVDSFYDEGSSSKSDTKTEIFTVRDCTGTDIIIDDDGIDDDNGDDDAFEVITSAPTGQVFATPVTKKTSSFFNQDISLMLLILANVLLIVMIIIVISFAGRR